MTLEEKKFHVSLLEKLLDKQKTLYTRLSLSEDPEAKDMKNKIMDSAVMMGMPQNMDMNIIFNNMSSLIDLMKNEMEKES